MSSPRITKKLRVKRTISSVPDSQPVRQDTERQVPARQRLSLSNRVQHAAHYAYIKLETARQFEEKPPVGILALDVDETVLDHTGMKTFYEECGKITDDRERSKKLGELKTLLIFPERIKELLKKASESGLMIVFVTARDIADEFKSPSPFHVATVAALLGEGYFSYFFFTAIKFKSIPLLQLHRDYLVETKDAPNACHKIALLDDSWIYRYECAKHKIKTIAFDQADNPDKAYAEVDAFIEGLRPQVGAEAKLDPLEVLLVEAERQLPVDQSSLTL